MVDTAMTIAAAGTCWKIDLSVYADGAERIATLRKLWSRAVVDSDEDAVFRPVPAGASGSPILKADPPEAFPYAFSRALTRASIERRAGSALLLHAAGLVSADGRRALVMVAASGTGKSTAARTLGRSFGYLSDELIAIEDDNTVSAFPKPISIIVDDFPGGKDELSPDELGLGPTPTTRPHVAAVLQLQRDRTGAQAEPNLERTTVPQALATLTAQSSAIWRSPQPLRRLAVELSRAGGPFLLTYSEIADCEDIVASLLAADNAAPSNARWVGILPSDNDRWRQEDAAAPLRVASENDIVRRAPWTDAIDENDEIAVLCGPQLSVLAGLGATVWRAGSQTLSIAALVELARDAHGEHPDAVTLVRQAVAELITRRLLVVVTD